LRLYRPANVLSGRPALSWLQAPASLQQRADVAGCTRHRLLVLSLVTRDTCVNPPRGVLHFSVAENFELVPIGGNVPCGQIFAILFVPGRRWKGLQ